MPKQYRHFLLVPDSSAARRIRRAVITMGSCSGIVVGTWLELLEYARCAYLIPELCYEWKDILNNALSEIDDAFWSDSYSISPQDTSTVIEAAFIQIISAFEPFSPLHVSKTKDLSERPQRHINDLIRLNNFLDGKLPADLAMTQKLLTADASEAIQQILVYNVDDIPAITRWQTILINKLNQDAGIPLDKDLNAILADNLSNMVPLNKSFSLATLQTQLFLEPENKIKIDGSVQWVRTRDFFEEAEVAAGMVQTMLAEHSDMCPADIGLMLPNSFEYSIAVNDAFTIAGLALSGLPIEHWQRDLGREALFHFLYCRQKPAPTMALAVCLSSPLMPWSRENGALMAQNVMDGDYRLRPFKSARDNDRLMLDLIRNGDDNPNTLVKALRSFVNLLEGKEDFEKHVYQAKIEADKVCTILESLSEINWGELRLKVTPKYITTGESPNFNLEGVTVWSENQEPWRQVHHLIVLGFSENRYPTKPGLSSVFAQEDLDAIKEHLGLHIYSPSDELKLRRARFKRQLMAVTDFVSFLIPHRNISGLVQSPSQSLLFMKQLFEVPKKIILELDSAEDRKHVHYLAQIESEESESPRTIVSNDIKFDRNLLELRMDVNGSVKPESPSSLETLMISPLAWLLRRLDAEPIFWEPEGPGVMLYGTLAHQVFENLFMKGSSIPRKDDILEKVNFLLNEAIQQHGPFLRMPQWQVERRHLTKSITEAVITWRDFIEILGAEVLGGEEWLEGKLNGVSIHGKTDVLLSLPDNRLLVVDYKRSSSNSRSPRMLKGYDSQVSLYRIMLQTGGPKDQENIELASFLKKADQIIIVYYLMNDKSFLSDSVLKEYGRIPGWEAIEGEVASQAMELIKRRLDEVQSCMLCLNRDGDAKFFEKQAGLTPYALENSPLINLFSIPGETEVVK
ncbi:PD-(D/E)XK nuclease family protein [Candidatus Latescibacterota bacterium]